MKAEINKDSLVATKGLGVGTVNLNLKPLPQKVWVLQNSESHTGSDSILGLFYDENEAKLCLADYVLENNFDTSYLELFEKEIN